MSEVNFTMESGEKRENEQLLDKKIETDKTFDSEDIAHLKLDIEFLPKAIEEAKIGIEKFGGDDNTREFLKDELSKMEEELEAKTERLSILEKEAGASVEIVN
jgi:hypothetical protein